MSGSWTRLHQCDNWGRRHHRLISSMLLAKHRMCLCAHGSLAATSRQEEEWFLGLVAEIAGRRGEIEAEAIRREGLRQAEHLKGMSTAKNGKKKAGKTKGKKKR